MSLANSGRAHQQKPFVIPGRIFVDESLPNQLRALQRLRVLRRPDFSVGQIGDVALKIAVFVAFGDARAIHAPGSAFTVAAVARHGKFPRTIFARDELPTSSLAELAIFEWHLSSAYGHTQRTASRCACGIL